jgi:ABC-type sugar transport system substrate-binding protein
MMIKQSKTALVVGFLSCCLLGCQQDQNAESPVRIGMMPKLMGISFFDAAGRGAQEAAEELGVDLTYDGPTEDNTEQQAEMIEAWVAQGFDVIAVAPNDPDAIAPTLSSARSQGVQVITWDTDADVETSQRSIFVNQAPAEDIANTLVDVMVRGAGENKKLTGQFVIISGTKTAANQNSWMEIMVPRLQQHPDCELLETRYPTEDQLKAREETANLLAAYPELRGIWAITSVALPAAAKAVRDAGRQGQVFVTGLSLPSLMGDYVQDGTVEEFVLFDVEKLGYLTVQVAAALHRNPLLPAESRAMGKLDSIRITEREAILGKPLVFDKNNIDQYNF